jgi:hypothetical protein
VEAVNVPGVPPGNTKLVYSQEPIDKTVNPDNPVVSNDTGPFRYVHRITTDSLLAYTEAEGWISNGTKIADSTRQYSILRLVLSEIIPADPIPPTPEILESIKSAVVMFIVNVCVRIIPVGPDTTERETSNMELLVPD